MIVAGTGLWCFTKEYKGLVNISDFNRYTGLYSIKSGMQRNDNMKKVSRRVRRVIKHPHTHFNKHHDLSTWK